jgi:hypothetical protein
MMDKQRLYVQSQIQNSSSVSDAGRDYLVAEMIPIVGDTIMNGILYPDQVIENTFEQFDNMFAPDSHPTESIHTPQAINAHHFGAFARNPKKNGKTVTAELWIDKEFANRSERGKKILSAIENKATVGVSTGGWAELQSVSNSDKFESRVINIGWDHIAVLLDEKPAGDNTYIQNENATEKVFICNTADAVEHVEEIQGDGTEPEPLPIDDPKPKQEDTTMETNEMKQALEADGFAVITNDRKCELEAIEAKEIAALNAKRETLAELNGVKAEAFANMDEDAIDKLIANAEEAKALKDAPGAPEEKNVAPVDNSLRGGGGAPEAKTDWTDEIV